jgi:hypothetical protein
MITVIQMLWFNKLKKASSSTHLTTISFPGTMILTIAPAIILTLRINRMDLGPETLSSP